MNEKKTESKFETKNPLKRQHVVTVHINYLVKEKAQKVVYLYKHSVGEPALTAKGTILPYWYTSKSLRSKARRLLKGIKSVQKGKLNVAVKEYYSLMLGEIRDILEADKYWRNRDAECVVKLWGRVQKVLNEIAEEDIDIEIPEMVTYFYNFYMPSHMRTPFMGDLSLTD